MVEGPDWGGLQGMLDEVRRSLSELDENQRKLMRVNGIGWSDDRLIKAVVGPRGQLVDLDIDPRVYRTPDATALAAAIQAAVRVAVEDAAAKTRDLLDELTPEEQRTEGLGSTRLRRIIESHDGDPVEDDDDGGSVAPERW